MRVRRAGSLPANPLASFPADLFVRWVVTPGGVAQRSTRLSGLLRVA